ncbi:hypothetical protein HJFPF1_01993 [Paramyrothecium foliicola]|nr:hypothetical protein HJFPF1_01993 [Paramyrothecium foliicola]
MTSSTVTALRQTRPSRSLRILVSPKPVTFAERRSVLQALQQFGPIEVFRMTPGYYSNYISVTKDVATAESLVTRSPLRYNLSTSQSDADATPRARNQTDSLKVTTAGESSTDDGFSQPDKQFTLQIIPQRFYKHGFAMARSPLSKPWPAAYCEDSSFMSTALKQTLPPTVAAKGLAHWLVELDSQPNESMKDARLAAKGWIPSAMAKDSKYEDAGVTKELERKPRSAEQGSNRNTNLRRNSLRSSHGDPWAVERGETATVHPVGHRPRKAF